MTAKYPFSVDPTEFSGKRVLVTGGTKGLGAATVLRFVEAGASVATTARSPAASLPASVKFIAADVATAEGARIVERTIQQAWGGLDILVNNVGGSESVQGGFEALTDEYWQRMLDWNLLSAIRLDRAFLPGMVERKAGAIIHISSVWHKLAQANSFLAYSTVKGAIASYSKGLSKAVAPSGVRVNMVSPGFMGTESALDLIRQVAEENMGGDLEAAKQQIIAMSGGIPMGRLGRPEEISEVVAFLASDRAGFTSGVDYIVDGGACPTL